MRAYHYIVAGTVAVSLVVIATVLAPFVFAQRVTPGVHLVGMSLVGVPLSALPGVVAEYERQLRIRSVDLVVGKKVITRSLGSLGVTVDHTATIAAIMATQADPLLLSAVAVTPVLAVKQAALTKVARQEFPQGLTFPQDATLTVTPSRTLALRPSASGQDIDLTAFRADLEQRASANRWDQAVKLKIVAAPASVVEAETSAANTLASRLLREGVSISDGTTTWTIQPFTIARLLRFIPVPDPARADNQILGVTFDAGELRDYLTITIAPAVVQPAINARFVREADIVTQFAVPQVGRALNLDASVAAIQQALQANQGSAQIVIDTTEPAVRDVADSASLGIGELLARGESDFSGSPANRIHNIVEGTKRYHGLLLPAGQEFSFNEFLGPVDREHGFKPELVIKNNRTIPEFGGGLCQVSTTVFRAATNAGLKITQRRNHAYAVRYYGIPGFDATIYPPYTDLRFTNNTPGYILFQAKIEGTKLTFEVWGTSDGRAVTVDGPHPYGRTSNGAVKATLVQTVIKDGAVIVDDTFYSNYRSPALFPKQPPTTNAPTTPATPTASPSPAPAVSGASAAKPTPIPSPKPKPAAV